MKISLKILFILSLTLGYITDICSQQVQLNGKVLEINSRRTPIPNVKVKSDNGANAVQSDSKGEYTLIFQDQGYGALVFVDAQKSGYELVNEKAMQLFLPDASQDQKRSLEIILCKKGYLDKARTEYYEITDKYIKEEFKIRYDRIITEKKEGWQKERALLQEQMDKLAEQLKKQADDYIITNRDDLTEKELEALQLFEAGKLDESLAVRASMNSEEELRKELENNRRAKENKAKAENEIKESEKSIVANRRNLKAEADGFILKFDFSNAERKLRFLAINDSTNFESVFDYAYFLADQYINDEAILFFSKSVKIAKTDRDIANAKNLIASIYTRLSKYDLALKNYKIALSIRNELANKNNNNDNFHSDLGITLNDIGLFYWQKNEYDLALQNFKAAMEIRTTLEKNNPKKYQSYLADTQNNIGIIYQFLNQYEEAIKYYKLSLSIYEKLTRENTTRYEADLADVEMNIGNLYTELKKYDRASKSLEISLEIYQRLAEKNSPKYITRLVAVQSNLGRLYLLSNKYDLALDIFQLALTNCLSNYYPDLEFNLDTKADIREFLGYIYLSKSDYETAISHYQKALEIRKKLAFDNPEKHNPKFALSQYTIGDIYDNLSDYESALKHYKIALKITKRLAKEYPKEYKSFYEQTQLNVGVMTKLAIRELEQKMTSLEFLLKVPIQKSIINKYSELFNFGYDYRLEIGNSFGKLAFCQLFDKDFKGAEQSAKKALNPTSFEKPKNYDKEVEWVHTNLVLALLYQGNYGEAKTIYLSFKDKPYGDNTYREAFLEDLEALEKEGITHPDVQKIRKLLND